MTKIQMPDPVAYRWRTPISDNDGNQVGESDWRFGKENVASPWWTRDSLITTTKAEVYANERVKEALEEGGKVSFRTSKGERMKAEKVRTEFEEAMSSQGEWPQAVERLPCGGYKLSQTAVAWEVWQSAWECAIDHARRVEGEEE